MTVTVIGLGKIGLPIAVQIAEKGFDVIGLDINEKLIRLINNGVSPFDEEEDLEAKLKFVTSQNNLSATTNLFDAVSEADIILFAIPLIIDDQLEPDFRIYDTLIQEVSLHVKEGALLLFETTLPIGTTRNRFVPIIEKYSKKVAGKSFFVAFSPERVTTGRIFKDLKKYPKIVGGIDPESTKKAHEFYNQVLDFDLRTDLSKPNGVWDVDSSESAEFVKLAETTYRDVNIGLANQFAKFSYKNHLSFEQIREAANSQPYSNIHEPGIAVGGHCIPVYPRFYSWNDESATVVSAARLANLDMPKFFIDELGKLLGGLQDKKILILGIAYREKVKESAYSGAFAIDTILRHKGAITFALDPLYTDEETINLGFNVCKNFSEIDAIVLHTKHEIFLKLEINDFKNLKVLADGRSFLKAWCTKSNVKYFSLG